MSWVDRSFVAALGGDPEDAALAHAIVKLGRTLHLRVVAEGMSENGSEFGDAPGLASVCRQ